ncbi:MAG: hypothetical protein L0Y72_04895 [Gemmataceae bacterium]|nr:hypothetical protein [Gemmataceae bacterium]
MTRKRRFLWFLGGVLLVSAAIAAYFVYLQRYAFVSPDDFAKIEAGMTENEVIAILGRDADRLGQYRTRQALWARAYVRETPKGTLKEWFAEKKLIQVEFQDGRVIFKSMSPRHAPTFVENIKKTTRIW